MFLLMWIGSVRKFIWEDRGNIPWWWNFLGFGFIANKSKGWSQILLKVEICIRSFIDRMCGSLPFIIELICLLDCSVFVNIDLNISLHWRISSATALSIITDVCTLCLQKVCHLMFVNIFRKCGFLKFFHQLIHKEFSMYTHMRHSVLFAICVVKYFSCIILYVLAGFWWIATPCRAGWSP